MKYIIHHKELLGPTEIQHAFENEIIKNTKPIENILSGYSKYPAVEIFISKINPALFRISVSLKLKNKLLYLETKGVKPMELIKPLFDQLRNHMKGYLITERRKQSFQRRERRTTSFTEHTNKLEQLFTEKETEQFYHLIQQLSPALKQYALRFLKLHGKGRKTHLTIEEILDEIFIALFERFNERPAATDRQSAWSYKIANETLQKILEQYTEDAEGQLDVLDLAAQEMKSLEERYTIDAEGHLIMYEDLDDVSYHHPRYGAEVLPDDQLLGYFDITDTGDASINLHEQISDVLKNCTDFEIHVFELYWLDELTEEEVSEATNTEVKKVKKIIEKVTQKIVTHLKS